MAAAEHNPYRADSNVADATHELYRRYGRQIYAYCLHHLRSREEAEDAVQTTFLNAFRGLQRGTTTHNDQAWLYKIAQNVCFARSSSSCRRMKLEAPNDFEVLKEIVPTKQAGDSLELMGLEQALERMPENQRRAILLREWKGLSYREIARELEVSQGAVEMLIFRARHTLANALEAPAAESLAGKRQSGVNLGGLVAAMKSLLNGALAVKMAAVAMSAAVVTSSAGEGVVHRITHEVTHVSGAARVRHSRPVAKPAPSASVAANRVANTQLVAWKHPHTTARPAAATRRHASPAVVSAGSEPAPAAQPETVALPTADNADSDPPPTAAASVAAVEVSSPDTSSSSSSAGSSSEGGMGQRPLPTTPTPSDGSSAEKRHAKDRRGAKDRDSSPSNSSRQPLVDTSTSDPTTAGVNETSSHPTTTETPTTTTATADTTTTTTAPAPPTDGSSGSSDGDGGHVYGQSGGNGNGGGRTVDGRHHGGDHAGRHRH